jgi:ribosome biogenesis protein MAK21
MLLKMAKKKNRRQTEACVIALKDLFLDDILTNKKLNTFINTLTLIKSQSQKINSESPQGEENSSENNSLQNFNINLPDDKLIEIYEDDYIHRKYTELLEIIEDIVINDPLQAIKKKFMNILLDMIMKKPEKEEKILDVLVNKLGDPEVDTSNHAIKLLKNLQMSHPKMSLIILKNVQNFITKIPIENQNAKYYALVYLTQMIPVNEKDFLNYSLEYFFDLFNFYTNISDEAWNNKKSKKKKFYKNKKDRERDEINPNKFLSLIVKRINIICKYAAEKNISIKKLLDEKMDTLFRLSHSESIKLRVEVLKLIFMICQGMLTGSRNQKDQNVGSKKKKQEENNKSIKNENTYLDRYYRSLYEVLLIKEVIFSKNLREILKLIMMSLSFDTNICRVAAFLKRLLQMSLHAEPPFITCALIIVSQILRNKHKLWRMVEKNTFNQGSNNGEGENDNEEDSQTIGYDFMKRDPLYTNADAFPLAELHILASHYHPTVQRFSQFILENYNKDIISYEGDPLLDFSLLNFLEKFMLKNPKVKKDKYKKKTQVDKDEEELKKFLGEDELEDEKKNTNTQEESKGVELDFIKKFNEIEKVKSIKYEKNLEKKRKKQLADEEAEDIEKFADKVVEDEYEKLNKDVDEDPEFDNQDLENENNDKDADIDEDPEFDDEDDFGMEGEEFPDDGEEDFEMEEDDE